MKWIGSTYDPSTVQLRIDGHVVLASNIRFEYVAPLVCDDQSHHPDHRVIQLSDCMHPDCQVRHVMES